MAQLVEHNLAKVGVAGSSPVVRSIWAFSSGGERFPDTEEVTSSNLVTPTTKSRAVGVLRRRVFCRATAACHQLQFPMAHPSRKVVKQNANQTPSGGHRAPQAPTANYAVTMLLI